MHILVLNHNFRGQGTYWRALQFARQLHARGHVITMMCVARDRRYGARHAVRDGFTFIETPQWAPGLDAQEGWGPIDLLYRTTRALTGRVDAVISFSHKPNCVFPAWVSRLRWSCPWVSDWCDWWGGPEGLFSRWVIPSEHFESLPAPVRAWRRFVFRCEGRREERVRRKADLVTTISRTLADRAERLGIPRDRICHIPSGAPTGSIRPQGKGEARKSLGLSERSFLLGYMANFHLDEDLLLGAFARLLETVPEAVMLVMGPPFDHAERLLTPEQIRRNVTHLGRVPFGEIETPMAASDALLMPLSDCHYNQGRWPNKIGDYLAAGRPVVTNAVGDAPTLVENHRLGWVGPATPEGFADAMRRAWEDRADWEDAGRRARHVAETELDWGRLTDQLITRVRDLTGLDLSPSG